MMWIGGLAILFLFLVGAYLDEQASTLAAKRRREQAMRMLQGGRQ
jgi:hypothetical protein